MNSFKKHIYKDNKIKQKITELDLIPIRSNIIAFLPEDEIVQVRSNSDWIVGTTPNWFQINSGGSSGSGNGLFSVNAQNNDSTNNRDYKLEVTAGSGNNIVVKEFEIIQAGAPPTLELEPETIEVSKDNPSNVDINVTTNLTWSVGNTPDWFDVTGSGGIEKVITINNIESNDTGSNRSFSLEVTGTYSGGSLVRTVEVSQIGINQDFSISPVEKEVSKDEQSYDVIITANVSWTISEQLNWAQVDIDSGMNYGIISVSVSANGFVGGRTGSIFFVSDNLTIKHDIIQAAGSS